MAITGVGITTVAPTEQADTEDVAKRRRRGLSRLLVNGKVTAGLVMLAVFTLIAIFGEALAPFEPGKRSSDILQSPSLKHWFGTTHIGQDIFSQVLVGTRSVMFVGFAAGVVATIIAVLIGVTSGYLAGTAA